MSDCEFSHEGHCTMNDYQCPHHGHFGYCWATSDNLIEACCPDPSCCSPDWNGKQCDCGEECSGCPIEKIMRG